MQTTTAACEDKGHLVATGEMQLLAATCKLSQVRRSANAAYLHNANLIKTPAKRSSSESRATVQYSESLRSEVACRFRQPLQRSPFLSVSRCVWPPRRQTLSTHPVVLVQCSFAWRRSKTRVLAYIHKARASKALPTRICVSGT